MDHATSEADAPAKHGIKKQGLVRLNDQGKMSKGLVSIFLHGSSTATRATGRDQNSRKFEQGDHLQGTSAGSFSMRPVYSVWWAPH
jgi:hypothetical protein